MKFTDHVDHVVWVCHEANIRECAAQLGALCGVQVEGPWMRSDVGMSICLSWEAGLEIVAPHAETTAVNQMLHDHLAAHGEGMFAIVFGVNDIAVARDRARALGRTTVDMSEGEDSPWADKHDSIIECLAGSFLNTRIIFGEIEYPKGVITFAE
jgi:hypothetical protein